MAISGQSSIRIGAENSPANSDSLYEAFTKVEQNFNRLFSDASPYSIFSGTNGVGASSNVLTGTVTLFNTGVTRILPGTGISLSGSNGNVVVSVSGNVTGSLVAGVTGVGISSNTITVTNTPIVSSGLINIDLPSQGNVTPGTYNSANITVDQYGRITAIANAAALGTVTSVALVGGVGVEVSGGPITSNGSITVTNTGVTAITAGFGIALTGSNGNVTISATPQPAPAPTAGGSNGQIQLNTGGFLSGDSGLTYDAITDTLTTGNLILSGTITDANSNITFAQWVTAPGSNTASGVEGQVAYDAGGNLFVCVATNTWSKITGTTSW